MLRRRSTSRSSSMRRRAGSGGTAAATASSLNGSMAALYSPTNRCCASTAITVLIVGSDASCNRMFVDKLCQSAIGITRLKVDIIEPSIQFTDRQNTVRRIQFFELDSEKDDLWTTLNADGYIFIFSVQDLHSYREAIENIGNVENKDNNIHMWMVGVTADPANVRLFSQRAVSIQDVQNYCKQQNMDYWEVARDGKTKRSPLAYAQLIDDLVTKFGGISSTDNDMNAIDITAGKKIKVDQLIGVPRRKTSRSCNDLSDLNTMLRDQRFFS